MKPLIIMILLVVVLLFLTLGVWAMVVLWKNWESDTNNDKLKGE